jgi:hypothetical protein
MTSWFHVDLLRGATWKQRKTGSISTRDGGRGKERDEKRRKRGKEGENRYGDGQSSALSRWPRPQ